MAQYSAPASLLGKISAYTELLEKDPCSTIFVPLSEAYLQMGMRDEAVEVVKKGIMENPAFSTGYVALGRAYVEVGLVDQAVGEFEKALILDGRNLSALKDLAKVRLQQEDQDSACELLKRARGIKGNDAEVIKMLAALEIPRPPVVTPALVVAQPEPGGPLSEPDSSEKGAEPIATATIAEIYVQQGFPEKALKVYRDLLRAEPQNDLLRQKLVQLKQHLAHEGLSPIEEESNVSAGVADVVGARETVAIAPSLDETPETPSTMTAASVAESAGRSVADVLSAWLVTIRRRREAHV